ncbi:MAG: SusD/RagB family nutrient-binding outer membrane lipoprotein [Chitinophagaceae bacterium]|nr:SusD/RagB family nutrient-binding outer membrane lipoprotein [Chitinophagaceae bacterium]
MIKILKQLSVAGVLVFSATSCEKNFGEINTDPSVVINPDIKFLLSYAEDKMVTGYGGTEWVWESMEQLFRYTQHVTTDPYEITTNVNARYNNYYQQILPNLFEIRRQIDLKEDKEAYQKMGAVTYVLQVCEGLKVTDMNGSIPYTEAIKGRYEDKYDPVYNDQQALFTTWLSELDNAIATLSNGSLPAQFEYGSADIYFKSDWAKWIKLANSLKLRIAARLENQDVAKTKQLFQQVLQDATGPIDADNGQLQYESIDYHAIGGSVNYRSTRYGTTSIINFLKKSNDPRIGIYFEKNQLTGKYTDTLAKYGATLPAFINPADPLIVYQGGPADWTTNPAVATYINNPFVVGNNNPGNQVTNYRLISPINRRFFYPKYNDGTGPGTGEYTEMLVSYAETCLLIAEFIEKGYAGGVDTKGSAEDWYRKGIASSIRTMNNIASVAESGTAFSGNGDALINAYLENPEVKFNGVNDLERIYIQQYINLYRNPNEAFVFVRRTGYPKKTSGYYARETFNEQIARRWWTNDPGEVNRANWSAALSEQGFTPNQRDLPTLSTQRIWYDKNAPAFGEGN